MSPDNDQTPPVTPLPEVPQIIPTEPTTPAQTLQSTAPTPVEPSEIPHVPSVTPEVPTVSAPIEHTAPSPAQPPFIPSVMSPVMPPTMPPTMTPVTPVRPIPTAVFTDISPAPAPQTNPTVPPENIPTSFPPMPPTETPAVNQPVFDPSQAPVEAPAAKKPSRTGLLIGLIIGAIIIVTGIAVLLFFFVFSSTSKVAESDLVSSTVSETTYLRPAQWKELNESGLIGYGNMLAKDNKSTAAVTVNKGLYIQSGIDTLSSEKLTAFRKVIVDTYTNDYASSTLEKSGMCSEVKNVATEVSTIKNTNSAGIFKITGTCIKDDETYKLVYYALLGKDGYARTVQLMATENLWKQNETVFNKMLDSADQS